MFKKNKLSTCIKVKTDITTNSSKVPWNKMQFNEWDHGVVINSFTKFKKIYICKE